MDDEQPRSGDSYEEEAEVVDGEIVLAGARALEPMRAGAPQLRQVAAVAATGFVAGAATAAVLGRALARQQARRAARAPAPAGERSGLPGAREGIVIARSHIVAVHAIARR